MTQTRRNAIDAGNRRRKMLIYQHSGASLRLTRVFRKDGGKRKIRNLALTLLKNRSPYHNLSYSQRLFYVFTSREREKIAHLPKISPIDHKKPSKPPLLECPFYMRIFNSTAFYFVFRYNYPVKCNTREILKSMQNLRCFTSPKPHQKKALSYGNLRCEILSTSQKFHILRHDSFLYMHVRKTPFFSKMSEKVDT